MKNTIGDYVRFVSTLLISGFLFFVAMGMFIEPEDISNAVPTTWGDVLFYIICVFYFFVFGAMIPSKEEMDNIWVAEENRRLARRHK